MSRMIEFIDNKANFRLIYLIVSIIFITYLGEIRIFSSISSKIMLLWGIYILFKTVVKREFDNYTMYHGLLVLFLLISSVSSLLNPHSSESIKSVVVALIQLFVVFSLDKGKSEKKLYRDIALLCKVFVVITLVNSIISLLFYVFHISISTSLNTYGMLAANHFSGVYNNENALGLISVISIITSLPLLQIEKGKLIKTMVIFNFPVQFIVLILSRTNSAFLALGAFILSMVFLKFKKGLSRRVFALSIAAIGTFGLYKMYDMGFLQFYLNGRYNLWKVAMKAIEKNPVLGVGYANIADYIKSITNLPMVGIEGGGLHNIFIQIAVANGIAAALVLLIFIFTAGFKIVGFINECSEPKANLLKVLFSIMMSIVAINLVEANMLYMISFIGFAYWIVIGFIFNLISVSREKL